MRDEELAERLAARTLELVDVPSESRAEGHLGEHVAAVLEAGGVPVADLGDTCLRAGHGAPVLLAGHLDTVPAQDNLPGRIDGARVHGLGASDMKGALAVMIELALAGADARDVWRRVRYVLDQARAWTDAGGRGVRRFLPLASRRPLISPSAQELSSSCWTICAGATPPPPSWLTPSAA